MGRFDNSQLQILLKRNFFLVNTELIEHKVYVNHYYIVYVNHYYIVYVNHYYIVYVNHYYMLLYQPCVFVVIFRNSTNL
jgi:hypothetical protein